MKKVFLCLVLALLCHEGFAQAVIDPLLSEEMARRNDDEQIKVVVIMKSHYDRLELNRRADYYSTRAERREFVVNELKEFANAAQYDLKCSLAGMERMGMVTTPVTLWMSNALYFSASKLAIQDLTCRKDIELISYAIERNWIPEEEEAKPASTAREITPNLLQVNADDVWAMGYKGEGVLVAIIDTGVNYNHVDVADHLWDGGEEFPYHGYDVINHDNDPIDDHGHGSHCAGILCGDGTAGSQTGVAPEVTLMCVKSMSATGHCTGVNIAEGIQWAVEHGCDMFTMSMGLVRPASAERVLLRRTCEAALDAGIVAAIAAGNEGNTLDEHQIPYNVRVPGSCPPPYMDDVQDLEPGGLSCSVCVGAVDYNDEAAYFTSQGPATWQDTEFDDYPYNPGMGLIRPDVCAPGVDIKSLYYGSNQGYINMSGTSMATPCVAGCMALMLSKNINLTPAEVCRILEETAVPLEEGKSNIFGFGRVDALAAIEATPFDGIRYQGFSLNDPMGNNNHRLNPGESVSMSLTLCNVFDEPVSGVSAVLTTGNQHVTLIQDTIVFPAFAANDTINMEDAFAFMIDNQVIANQKIGFSIEIYVDGELRGVFKDKMVVYDYLLQYDITAVLNDDNNDGFLDPGETANLRIIIDNKGNEMAQLLMGTLLTDNVLLTLNDTGLSFGTIGAEMMGYADFSVSLDVIAPQATTIPFTLDLVDVDGRHTVLIFSYKNDCLISFLLHDSFGDGWQDNYLQVDYSDGTPSEQLTIVDGASAVYSHILDYASSFTLSWHHGQWEIECSFEILYEDGTVIYQNSGGFNDTLSFVVDCKGNIGVPDFCEPVRNLDYETNGCQVVLNWDTPEDGTPILYEVYRGTVLVETTSGCSAVDVVEEGLYNYCVYAIYRDCQSEFACIEVEMRNIAPEIHFTDVREGWISTVWNVVEGAIAYNLYRDNDLIAENITETTYNDTEMTINAVHCYAVASVFEKGVSDLSVAACANYFTGVGENGGKLSIYPNPTSDKVNVMCVGMSQIDIYSVEGKLVSSMKVEDDVVQIDGLESGVYTLRIHIGDEIIIYRVIKQ